MRPAEPPGRPEQSLREQVWMADGGRCVGCSKRLPLRAGAWVWQAHHVIKQQVLERHGYEHLIGEPEMAVLVCRACHEGQTSAMRQIPGNRLPQRCHDAARELGPWATDVVKRMHP
jgi:hypothetical protein